MKHIFGILTDFFCFSQLFHPITKEVSRIRCEFFVNSANNYLSRNLGKCSVTKVRVPVLACEHQILQTHPFQVDAHDQDKTLPIINDFDNRFTVYQRDDGDLCMTGYEKVSRVVRKREFKCLFIQCSLLLFFSLQKK